MGPAPQPPPSQRPNTPSTPTFVQLPGAAGGRAGRRAHGAALPVLRRAPGAAAARQRRARARPVMLPRRLLSLCARLPALQRSSGFCMTVLHSTAACARRRNCPQPARGGWAFCGFRRARNFLCSTLTPLGAGARPVTPPAGLSVMRASAGQLSLRLRAATSTLRCRCPAAACGGQPIASCRPKRRVL
jgi:hypothetical protein